MLLSFITKYTWARSLVLAAVILPGLSHAQTITYTGPLVITKGGTYTGNYQSTSSQTPCVLINTTQPVTLDGCNLQGPGNLIQSGTGANLTVRNCRGNALAPTVNGQAVGHFLGAYQAQSLVIEHNTFTGSTGIIVDRWTPGGTLTVRYNQARNIDGRWRNGGGSTASSFLQLNTVTSLGGVEIAYNEVINEANKSLVEDNINFYNSSGTAASPIRVHDNFVRGAYPYPATASTYTGTGMTTDGDAITLGLATGYIEASRNQFVGTCNAAMNIAAGHDIYYHDNRMVTSGLLPGGTRLAATHAATAVFNYYSQPAALFFNNRISNNTIGYVRWGANNPYPDRQDLSPGACATCWSNTSLPNPITLTTEDNEYSLWQQKVQQAGITLGPVAVISPVATISSGTGAVVNPGFEADNTAIGSPAGWQTTPGSSSSDNADYTETYPGAHSGTYHATHYRPEAYEVYTYQVVKGLANGTYTLKAWVRNSGGQRAVQLQAKNYGGNLLSTNISASPDAWMQVSVPNIVVSNGQCELGFYSNANPGNWLYFDDIELVAQNSVSTTSPAPTISTPTSSTATGTSTAVFPNPADTEATITATFGQNDVVAIYIVNAQGTTVVQHWRAAKAGDNQFTISTRFLPSGIYTLRIVSRTQATQTLQLQVVH